jgi:ribose 5-phosphate isomerase A
VAEDLDAAKAAAAAFAVQHYVRPGLRLALGTGSTASLAVREIRRRFPNEPFDCVASSRATEELARSLGMPVRELRATDRFDLMLDGADEVTPRFELTKGRGGALFREKLLAELTRQMVVLVDPTKLVAAIGERCPVPVEVVPYARPVLERRFADDGFDVRWRTLPDGRPFLTDNHNEILDLRPRSPVSDAARLERQISERTGVVATGLFLGLASRVVVGATNGSAEERLPLARPPS